MQTFDFTGRTVFVAGGTSGINLGIAEAFAEAGARLAVMSRSPERVEAGAPSSCSNTAARSRASPPMCAMPRRPRPRSRARTTSSASSTF